MSEVPASPAVSFKHTADAWNGMSLSRLTFNGKDVGVTKTIAALAFLSLMAIFLSGLAVLIILHLSYRQDAEVSADVAAARIGGVSWTTGFVDSSIVLSCVSLMFSFSSVVSCAAQCYFAAKMLKLPQGEERAHRFLSDTSATRFLGISSFFIAIPFFLGALGLFIVHEFRLVPAALSTAFLGLAIIFMIVTFGRSVWLWRREQDLIIRGVGVFEYNCASAISSSDGRTPFIYSNHVNTDSEMCMPTDRNKLSTLV